MVWKNATMRTLFIVEREGENNELVSEDVTQMMLRAITGGVDPGIKGTVKVKVLKTNNDTKEEYSVTVDGVKYVKWKYGGEGYVQTMFPELSAEQREFLKTGLTPDEWTELMGPEE